MIFSFPSAGYMAMNIAGIIAKYFATSFAMEKVVNAPRVISSCLPMATTSISLVGLLSRSTMLPASFAAIVPVFIANPTSACASAGASFVPSPVMATRRPAACSFLMYSSLSFGVACARKSSTPASAAIAAAVSGLSPVIITLRMPIRRMVGKTGQLSRIRKFLLGDAGDDQKFDGLPVTQRDCAGLIQQQRIDVTRGFYRLTAHRQHVMLHDTVHAGYADRGQQAADG